MLFYENNIKLQGRNHIADHDHIASPSSSACDFGDPVAPSSCGELVLAGILTDDTCVLMPPTPFPLPFAVNTPFIGWVGALGIIIGGLLTPLAKSWTTIFLFGGGPIEFIELKLVICGIGIGIDCKLLSTEISLAPWLNIGILDGIPWCCGDGWPNPDFGKVRVNWGELGTAGGIWGNKWLLTAPPTTMLLLFDGLCWDWPPIIILGGPP